MKRVGSKMTCNFEGGVQPVKANAWLHHWLAGQGSAVRSVGNAGQLRKAPQSSKGWRIPVKFFGWHTSGIAEQSADGDADVWKAARRRRRYCLLQRRRRRIVQLPGQLV